MKWFYNMKISKKLITAFILVAVTSGVLIGAVGIVNIKNINSMGNKVYTENLVPLDPIRTIYVDFLKIRMSVKDMALSKDADKSKYVTAINDLYKDLNANLDVYSKETYSDEQSTNFNAIKDDLDKYTVVKDKVVNLLLSNQSDNAIVLMNGDAADITKQLDTLIAKAFDLNISQAKERNTSNTASGNTAVAMMIIIILAAAAVSVILGIFISAIISKPLTKIVETADKIAQGDLDVNIEIESSDEIGKLAQSFEIMAAHLNETMSSIHSAADQAAEGARQVSASSQALSQGSTEQASSVEEITSAMTQVAAQTKQNAVNANQANEFAAASKENAIQGNSHMQEMVRAMDEINDSSANISKIIKVIDEIAFQTNILALNAAVEAARAGQHGKGFAVVAEEVRNLAARSANAAKETTAMIEGSIKKVEAGTKIARDTEVALKNILADVTKAAALVGDIAAASNEQATAIAQINKGVEQVSEVVQTNSATAEESAAASEELSSQAEILKNMVNKFKLKRTGSASYDAAASYDAQAYANRRVNPKTAENLFAAYSEASGSSKPRISLGDKEFGKY